MGVSKIFRLFSGYVRFCARGGFPERFINLCGKEEIPLWDISGGKREMYASTSLCGYRKIRSCARKSGMLPHIIKRRGLPFWLRSHKNRAGLLFGAAAGVMLVLYFSTMVWTVEVSGNDKVPDEKILTVFEEMGVRPGVKKRKIDADKLQAEGLSKIPELSWLAVNVKGSSAVIEVRERVPKPEMAETGEPQNLVAVRDGRIASVEVYEGKAAVKRGDEILKGELLVNGIVTNYDSSVTLCHARGKVTAYTKRILEYRQPYETKMLCKSEEYQKGVTLTFFNLKIPVLKPRIKSEKTYTEVKRCFIKKDSVQLPVGFTETEVYGCEDKELTLSEKRALALASSHLAEKELSELAGAAVLSRNVTAEFTDSECVLRGEYRCEETIAAPQKIDIESG